MKKCFPQMLPAQEFLLPSNTYLDSLTKQRYYKFFSEKLESFSVLKSDKEMIPMAATAVTWLIAQTRDEGKFPLINEENINFGFSYNLLGLKKCGIFLTLIGLAVNIIFYVLQMNFHLDLGVKLNALIASTIINFLFLLLWIVIVSKKLVKIVLKICSCIIICMRFATPQLIMPNHLDASQALIATKHLKYIFILYLT